MTDLALAYLACTLAVALYLHAGRGWPWLEAGAVSATWPVAAALALGVLLAWAILCSLAWYRWPRSPRK